MRNVRVNYFLSKAYKYSENGLVQKLNRAVQERIRVMCNESSYEWDSVIPHILIIWKKNKKIREEWDIST
ncbi:hypothetical protein A3Q56_04991 [Intoshia linei]|uniref:Integrase catalytic domain-containing protein n=1 Tax=Intoshia linei TaxID=1819745 RepID=A0A177AYK0_9BILA|nr:hypothetical protein A3Q56_04991 [Intoshia linei]